MDIRFRGSLNSLHVGTAVALAVNIPSLFCPMDHISKSNRNVLAWIMLEKMYSSGRMSLFLHPPEWGDTVQMSEQRATVDGTDLAPGVVLTRSLSFFSSPADRSMSSSLSASQLHTVSMRDPLNRVLGNCKGELFPLQVGLYSSIRLELIGPGSVPCCIVQLNSYKRMWLACSDPPCLTCHEPTGSRPRPSGTPWLGNSGHVPGKRPNELRISFVQSSCCLGAILWLQTSTFILLPQ